jgi:GNAT superfamily N-acetyltransferase
LSESERRRLPAFPLPVLRLARLAVASEVQGQGVGRLLLRTVFTLAWRMSEELGCVGVLVDAKPPAVGFYASLGFQELHHTRGALGDRPEPVPMFIALRDVSRP